MNNALVRGSDVISQIIKKISRKTNGSGSDAPAHLCVL